MSPLVLPPPRLVVTEIRDPFYVTDEEIDAWIEYQRRFLYVRETQGPNKSPEIHIFQTWCYGNDGDSWCDDAQSYTADRVWPHLPLERSGRCQTTRERARALGWLLPRGTFPKKGDQGFCIDVPRDHAHHTFGVTRDMGADKTFGSIEGNTNPGGSSNGYGYFERNTRRMSGLTTYEFARFPRKPV